MSGADRIKAALRGGRAAVTGAAGTGPAFLALSGMVQLAARRAQVGQAAAAVSGNGFAESRGTAVR